MSRWLPIVCVLVGCGRLGFDPRAVVAFVDDDASTFDLGTYDAGDVPLTFGANFVRFAELPPYTTDFGTYVSRVFDAGDPETRWDTLAWQPLSPARPLPDDAASDVGYEEGTISMAESTLLLHFDDVGPVEGGSKIADRSGRGHDGTVVLDGQQIGYLASDFNQGVAIERDAWVTLDGNDFAFGTSDFTYSIWVRMFDCSRSNNNRIAMGGAGAGDTPHMWIGALCPDSCAGGDGAFMNFLDSSRNGPSLAPCTDVRLDDGAWHHLAGVKRGHTAPAATVELYVDGREVARDTYDFGTNTFDYDAGEIRIGSFNLADPTYHTKIDIDEAAIWTRALAGREIDGLYRRGAVQLELQFRACSDGACDDEAFVGPDGTPRSAFSESDLVGPSGSQRGNLSALDLRGALGQYRVRFSTRDPDVSPGLGRVEISISR